MRDFIEPPLSRRTAATARSGAHPTPAETLDGLFAGARHATYPAGRAIRLDGDPIDEVYQVVAGSVRCCAFTEGGRRKIFRFARAGDFVGLVDVDVWRFSVEAVDSVVLRVVRRADVDAALEASPTLRRALRLHAVEVLTERERQLTVLAFESAEKRLLWFLREFAKRKSGAGFLTLPMTRREIGDYLGLSLETVSRCFGALRRAGFIEMNGVEKFRLTDAPSPRSA